MAHSEGFICCFTSARGQLKGEEQCFGRKDIKNFHSLHRTWPCTKAELIAFDKIPPC